jgi:hypothetical protein
VGKERYMPLLEQEFSDSLFVVGSLWQAAATKTGELVCFANDADGFYWDNSGSIT